MRDIRAFSLVEVMIALLIVTAIILTTVTIVNQNQAIHSGLNEEYALYHEVRAAMTLIEEDVSMLFILPPRYDLQAGQEIHDAVFVGSKEKMSAVTMNYRRRVAGSRDTHIREVEYFLVPDPSAPEGEPAFTLMRKTSSALDLELFGSGADYDVLTDLKSWGFSYYDEKTQRWEETWDSREGSHKNAIPKAVGVTFEVFERDPDDPFAKPTVLKFETKFLADASIEMGKSLELSKTVKQLRNLIEETEKKTRAAEEDKSKPKDRQSQEGTGSPPTSSKIPERPFP
jgi:type II secretory pathway component PulJ